MNFFETELRKIFMNQGILDNPTFVGRTCYGEIGEDLRARVEFVAPKTVDHFSAVRVSILNPKEGVIDQTQIRLEELLGIKEVPGNPYFRNGVSPYIWIYNGKADWYAFTPKKEDYEMIRESVRSYVDVFRPLEKRAALSDLLKEAATQSESTKQTAGRKRDQELSL